MAGGVRHDSGARLCVLLCETVIFPDGPPPGCEGGLVCHWYCSVSSGSSDHRQSDPFTPKGAGTPAQIDWCNFLVVDTDHDADLRLTVATADGNHIGVYFGNLKQLAASDAFDVVELELKNVTGILARVICHAAAQIRWTRADAPEREPHTCVFHEAAEDAQSLHIWQFLFDGKPPPRPSGQGALNNSKSASETGLVDSSGSKACSKVGNKRVSELNTIEEESSQVEEADSPSPDAQSEREQELERERERERKREQDVQQERELERERERKREQELQQEREREREREHMVEQERKREREREREREVDLERERAREHERESERERERERECEHEREREREREREHDRERERERERERDRAEHDRTAREQVDQVEQQREDAKRQAAARLQEEEAKFARLSAEAAEKARRKEEDTRYKAQIEEEARASREKRADEEERLQAAADKRSGLKEAGTQKQQTAASAAPRRQRSSSTRRSTIEEDKGMQERVSSTAAAAGGRRRSNSAAKRLSQGSRPTSAPPAPARRRSNTRKKSSISSQQGQPVAPKAGLSRGASEDSCARRGSRRENMQQGTYPFRGQARVGTAVHANKGNVFHLGGTDASSTMLIKTRPPSTQRDQQFRHGTFEAGRTGADDLDSDCELRFSPCSDDGSGELPIGSSAARVAALRKMMHTVMGSTLPSKATASSTPIVDKRWESPVRWRQEEASCSTPVRPLSRERVPGAWPPNCDVDAARDREESGAGRCGKRGAAAVPGISMLAASIVATDPTSAVFSTAVPSRGRGSSGSPLHSPERRPGGGFTTNRAATAGAAAAEAAAAAAEAAGVAASVVAAPLEKMDSTSAMPGPMPCVVTQLGSTLAPPSAGHPNAGNLPASKHPSGRRRLYRVTTAGLGVRVSPDASAARTGAVLRRGDIFEASVVAPGVDGRIYLKLAGARGWVFDDSKVDPEDPSVEILPEEEMPHQRSTRPASPGRAWATVPQHTAAFGAEVPAAPVGAFAPVAAAQPGASWPAAAAIAATAATATVSALGRLPLNSNTAHVNRMQRQAIGMADRLAVSEEFREAMGGHAHSLPRRHPHLAA